MKTTAEKILSDALKLPEQARAKVASRLLESLDADDDGLTQKEWEASWGEEIDRRRAELQSGKVKAIPAEKVFEEARRFLKRRK